MTYTEKLKRTEEIINQINSGNIDPSKIIELIQEAQGLMAECKEELSKLEDELK